MTNIAYKTDLHPQTSGKSRSAFTLFEILASVSVVTIVVLGSSLAIPQALRLQQMNLERSLAAAATSYLARYYCDEISKGTLNGSSNSATSATIAGIFSQSSSPITSVNNNTINCIGGTGSEGTDSNQSAYVINSAITSPDLSQFNSLVFCFSPQCQEDDSSIVSGNWKACNMKWRQVTIFYGPTSGIRAASGRTTVRYLCRYLFPESM